MPEQQHSWRVARGAASHATNPPVLCSILTAFRGGLALLFLLSCPTRVAPRVPRVDVNHYDGYLAVWQSGSLALKPNVAALPHSQWTPSQLEHRVSRTCSAARRAFGKPPSLLAVIQPPSRRLEAGYRRRYTAAKSSDASAAPKHDLDGPFLQAFPTAEALVQAARDASSLNHNLALDAVSTYSGETLGKPVTWYLDDDHPATRVTWLCWNQLKDHWRQATVTPLHLALEELHGMVLDKDVEEGQNDTTAPTPTRLSAESRLFVDAEVHANDRKLYDTVCPGGSRPIVTDGKGGYLGMIRYHVAPANITWLPAAAAAAATAAQEGAAANSDGWDGGGQSNGLQGGANNENTANVEQLGMPFADVRHINGYLAIARSGSLSLKRNIKSAWPPWDAGSLDHAHDRTSLMARSLLGATSLIATLRRPSDRLESGFRRRLDAVAAHAGIGQAPRNLKLLSMFPTVETLVETIQRAEAGSSDGSSENARRALKLVSKHSGQGWGKPVASYLDVDDPSFRITWLCLDRLEEHWEAATGLHFVGDDDPGNPMSHSGTHRSNPHPAAVLSPASRIYVDSIVYSDDTRLFNAVCPWDAAAGKAGGPRPFVTDGKGNILGPKRFASNFTAPRMLAGWEYPPRNPFEGNPPVYPG